MDGGTRAGTATGVVEPGYEALFRSTYARLVVALSFVAGAAAAEDAVQDAFVQALRHWPRVQGYDDPASWVRRTALNRLANHRRSVRRRDRAVERLGAGRGLEPTDASDADAAVVDLRAALADLPERERTVVVLHHVLGLPVAAIAADLELPDGTVKSILARTRARLRAELGDDEPSAERTAPPAQVPDRKRDERG